MVKILMGLAAVVVIAVGGFFGFEFYTQHRVAGEVETAFEQIRAGGGKASHGKVSFDADAAERVRIADIATEIGSAAAGEHEDRQRHRLGRRSAGCGPVLGRQHRSVGYRNRRQHRRSRQAGAFPTRCHGSR